MARLTTTTWESGEVEAPWAAAGEEVGVVTDQAHGGTHSLKSTEDGSYVHDFGESPFLEALDRGYYVGAWFRFPEIEPGKAIAVFGLFSGAKQLARLELQTNGTLLLRDVNGTQVGEASAGLQANEWHALEIFIEVPTEGEGQLGARLDGTVFAEPQEADVNNSKTFPSVLLFQAGGSLGEGSWTDDYALNDDTGGEDNSWPLEVEEGEVEEGETLEASAAGSGVGTGSATALRTAFASASGAGAGTGEATALAMAPEGEGGPKVRVGGEWKDSTRRVKVGGEWVAA